MGYSSVPPEAETILSLLKISSILALVFGILWIIGGALSLIFLVGIVFIVFGVVDLLIYYNIKSIIDLIDQRRYREAKDRTLTWLIIGFIFGGVFVGVLLLIAYLKYDELIRRAGPGLPPPPPP
ncbi:MAG: hypothetical protein QXR41_00040 [Nitrososphaerota archaeon]